ncbi:hypothetical protein BJV74DRAFT_885492 [Russula compacta]|nr:hypothetical protein BJV74DRAFT_885492 [Russula compacta]
MKGKANRDADLVLNACSAPNSATDLVAEAMLPRLLAMVHRWTRRWRISATACVPNELLTEIARDEGEEWVTEKVVEEGAEENPPDVSKVRVDPKSHDETFNVK